MDKLSNIIAFTTVAETKSFSEAGRRLRIANSVVSKRIKDLEADLGAELIRRTTRRVALTDAGYAYFEHTRRFLDELAEVEEHLRYRNENPVGELRVAAPLGFGNMFLGPAVAAFLERYPDVTVTLTVDVQDDDVGLPDDVDVAIRTGALRDSPLMARTLAHSRLVVTGSPAYLAAHGAPQTPEDLIRHNCLTYTGFAEGRAWPFRRQGREIWQRVQGRFRSDSGHLLCDAAARGQGLALLPTFIAGRAIVRGELSVVLEDFEREPMPIQAVYRPGRLLSARLRRFLEHLGSSFSTFQE